MRKEICAEMGFTLRYGNGIAEGSETTGSEVRSEAAKGIRSRWNPEARKESEATC